MPILMGFLGGFGASVLVTAAGGSPLVAVFVAFVFAVAIAYAFQ